MPNRYATQGACLAEALKKRPRVVRKWTADEMETLRREYPQSDTSAVARTLGRAVSSVQKQAQIHGIKKSKEFIREQKRAQAESASERSIATRFKPIHGEAGNKRQGVTYNAWQSMKARCLNESHKSFRSYGAVGVKICERWMTYTNFLEDMGPRPQGTTLDRWPNNSGNYEPGNCRWATPTQQARNRKTNAFIDAFGQRRLLVEVCQEYGIRMDTFRYRVNKIGWTVEKALQEPVARRCA